MENKCDEKYNSGRLVMEFNITKTDNKENEAKEISPILTEMIKKIKTMNTGIPEILVLDGRKKI